MFFDTLSFLHLLLNLTIFLIKYLLPAELTIKVSFKMAPPLLYKLSDFDFDTTKASPIETVLVVLAIICICALLVCILTTLVHVLQCWNRYSDVGDRRRIRYYEDEDEDDYDGFMSQTNFRYEDLEEREGERLPAYCESEMVLIDSI